jgi:hypothetical protein
MSARRELVRTFRNSPSSTKSLVGDVRFDSAIDGPEEANAWECQQNMTRENLD